MAYRTISYAEENYIVAKNELQFDDVLKLTFPELYCIWENIKLYKINYDVIPFILRAIGDICTSSKTGEVIIYIRPEKDSGEPIILQVESVNKTTLTAKAQRDYK
jgi:hypothetical protein